MKKNGTLYGVGVGPGDPELITLKGFNILNDTGVIAFPEARRGSGSYAKSIIETLLDTQKKEMVPLTFPMTRDPVLLENEWNNSVSTLLFYLHAGNDVAFVSEGDPLFYSTFIHLMQKIKDKDSSIDIQVIPGISALHGAAASLGWGLVNADQKFAVIPATENIEEMSREIDNHDTVVFYKAAKVIEPLVKLLTEKNLIRNAAVVTKATSSEEKIYENLAQLPPDGIPYLSLVIVRKTTSGSLYE